MASPSLNLCPARDEPNLSADAENDERASLAGFLRLTQPFRDAYAKSYVSPIRRQLHVLLLYDAGVWVGLSEILPTHPANAGGFHFHPLL